MQNSGLDTFSIKDLASVSKHVERLPVGEDVF
jgi:hypothetical protein